VNKDSQQVELFQVEQDSQLLDQLQEHHSQVLDSEKKLILFKIKYLTMQMEQVVQIQLAQESKMQ